MNGLEEPIENLLKEYIKNSQYLDFKYLEIGAASCVTLRAIYDIVKENINHPTWILAGLDLENGYSMDWSQINKCFSNDEILIIKDNNSTNYSPNTEIRYKGVHLYLKNDPRKWIENLENESIDIAFIDANHAEPEVIKDFEVIESKIKRNGMIWFHDTDVLSQGSDYQGDGWFISVRSAIEKLGLFDNKRSGWTFEKEILGSRFWGSDGNGMAIVRKI